MCASAAERESIPLAIDALSPQTEAAVVDFIDFADLAGCKQEMRQDARTIAKVCSAARFSAAWPL